jgi:lysophospholipase L1-like esterase
MRAMTQQQKKLLFIGDSLIEYFDWEQRFPGHVVYNLGISGETVDGLNARLGSIFDAVGSPDHIFIMTGINNLAMGDREIISGYRKMLKRILERYPEAKVTIHSLLPVLVPFIGNEEIRSMNEGLERLAHEEKVFYLDLHARFLDEKGRPVAAYLLDDGVHVSDEGYRTWSAEIERLIRG